MSNLKKKIHSVLNKAYPELKSLHDDYFIIGSSALVLSGIKIDNTSDIDILMSNKDADFLKEVWRGKIIKDHITKRDDLFRSNFTRYFFDNLDVEVMGDLEINKDGQWIPLIIQEYTTFTLKDIEIKTPTLQEQKRIYELFGREKDLEKVKLIEKED
jgi:hypothetical protein